MRLGIIIPNYCTAPHHINMLEETVRSIQVHEPGLLHRTYIVDDYSPLKSTYEELLRISQKWGCKVWFKGRNGGYSHTVNRGMFLLRHRGCEVALTLNSDCEVVTPFSQIVEKVFTFDPDISVIGGRLLYPSGKIQSAGQTVPEKGGVAEHYKNKYVAEDLTCGDARYVHSVTGAMQFIKLTAGDYDERFKMAYEDVEFCMRQWSEGKRVFYMPRIGGIHREGATRGRFPSAWELESVDYFDEVRNKTNISEHHKIINNLNEAMAIRKQQLKSPQ